MDKRKKGKYGAVEEILTEKIKKLCPFLDLITIIEN